MYKEFLESIKNSESGISASNQRKLETYCLQYVFNWSPFKRIKDTEPYKMGKDSILLETWKSAGITQCSSLTEKDVKKIRSETIKKAIKDCQTNSSKNDIADIVCSKISGEDIKIAFILKVMNEYIWQKRLQAIFANIFAILSLIISSFVALMVAILSNI
jgi:hypothetical protein